MKKTLIFLMSGFLLVTTAQAYSPPASFILGKVLKEHEKVKTLDLEGRFSNSTSGAIKESLHIDFPAGKVIAVYTNEAGENLGARVTKIQDLKPMGRAWIGVGMDPYGNRMRATLEDLGVYPQETTDVKIDRIGSRAVWTWGEASRLKVLKDEFVFAGYQNADNEIEVQSYTVGGVIRLPKLVHIKTGDYNYELKAFRMNAPLKTAPSLTPVRSPAVREWVELVR